MGMFCHYNCMEKILLGLVMFFIMNVYHTFEVRKRTITSLDIIKVEQSMKLMHFGKYLTSSLKTFLPIFVETLRLYGGLNYISFALLFLELFVTVGISFRD